MLRDPEVAELEVIARERRYVEAYGAAVRRMSADSLGRGLKALNQTDVGGALQVTRASKGFLDHMYTSGDASCANGALCSRVLKQASGRRRRR